MESVMSEMDLEEWELVPEEGYLEINNKIYSSRKVSSASTTTTTTSVFQMNYFICPAADQFVDKTQLLPYNNNNNDLQAAAAAAAATNKQAAAAAAGDQINYVNPPPVPVPVPDGDAAASSQSVFFKKITKETEFADIMKMDSSPRSMKNPDQSFDHHHHHQVDYDDDNSNIIKRNDDDQQQYFNIWKWSLTGIGAICSFGVAAACIITSANKHQNLHFQIYTNDKRMKQVASKLNEAISAVRGGVPVTRAHITFGGYYDASSP